MKEPGWMRNLYKVPAGFVCATLLACASSDSMRIEPGVSSELARQRFQRIQQLSYQLHLSIPDQMTVPIMGRVVLEFSLQDPGQPLLLDFKQPADHLIQLQVNRGGVEPVVQSQHIVIPSRVLVEGTNRVMLEFKAGEPPLNRREDYLYALFVPDRASEVFPCFDQPDLKARFRLSLEIPAHWKAVSNAPPASSLLQDSRADVVFQSTEPISTYLFSFAAGEFQVEEHSDSRRRLRMFHREADAQKLARNREEIFDLQGAALDWMEDYTGLPYPFAKYDFVLIPAFQFGGMEHPGTVFYRDRSLLLPESATQAQLLGRASLIAHETAHMWFGDLVTMRWFDDVWLKEVFANFMAAKIVGPSFPEINHDLRFLLSYHPSAYAVDRSEGTHAIRQELSNLNDAASLYGAIIYQKAPVVMRQLEQLIGAESVRKGLQNYLDRFRFGNASWPELIQLLDQVSDEDLATWSRRWVEEPGMPSIATRWVQGGDGLVPGVEILQSDPLGQGRSWTQRLQLTTATSGRLRHWPLQLSSASQWVKLDPPEAVDFVIVGSAGLGYGLVRPDPQSRRRLLSDLSQITEDLPRAAAWLGLWESLLAGEVDPPRLLDLALRQLSAETSELILQRILADLQTLYWVFLSDSERLATQDQVEQALWRELQRRPLTSLKASLFRSFRSIAQSERAVERLRQVWSEELLISGLTLEEQDFISLTLELALRSPGDDRHLLEHQLGRMQSEERKKRLQFVFPALSGDSQARANFFASLAHVENRRREPWVLEGLSYLHHPLRRRESIELVAPALELLVDVHQTGDIFFPQRWLDAVLEGHNSKRVAAVVRDYLHRHPELPERLRWKVLQSADLLFRASLLSF